MAKANETKDNPGVNKNPSGASDEQLKQGELVGKVRGQDVDSSYHVYDFTDPNTGEPIETKQVVHDVMVDADGNTEKGDASFAKGEGEGGASGGEAGETTKPRSRS